MTSIFLSYARGDDVDPFDPATSFVARLHRDLTAHGFEVWFDRIAMPSRGLTFHQEIILRFKGLGDRIAPPVSMRVTEWDRGDWLGGRNRQSACGSPRATAVAVYED